MLSKDYLGDEQNEQISSLENNIYLMLFTPLSFPKNNK